jgi:hypothetical protein
MNAGSLESGWQEDCCKTGYLVSGSNFRDWNILGPSSSRISLQVRGNAMALIKFGSAFSVLVMFHVARGKSRTNSS